MKIKQCLKLLWRNQQQGEEDCWDMHDDFLNGERTPSPESCKESKHIDTAYITI